MFKKISSCVKALYMFEDRATRNGVKIILPPIHPRPVSQQLPKRPRVISIPKRPQTVGPVLTPLDRLKSLRKLRRLTNGKHYP